MFRKLRIKFIAITMVMVAVVMALAFTVVCAVEYQRSYSVVQTALSDAAEQAMANQRRVNDGQNQGSGDMRRQFRFSESQSSQAAGQEQSSQAAGQDQSSQAAAPSQPGDLPQPDDEGRMPWGDGGPEASEGDSSALNAPDESSDNGQDAAQDAEQGNGAPPFIGNRGGQQRASSSLIPVAVYVAEANGQTHVVPQATTASISDDVLSEALGQMGQVSDGFGTLTDFDLHYHKVTREDESFFVFADTSYTDSWKTLAAMLVVVGLATLVVFFIISLFYSRWALRPVKEAWDSQRQFVADASHDLKTPLTVVLANSAILLKHPERTIASESQWIESTQKEAENMQGLVNEMLELAQIEAGEKVEVEKTRLDFSDLVDGETLLFDSVALERNCSFDCDVEAGIEVFGNETQVAKMLSTLVENAFKYVNDGGAVSVTLKRSGKMAQLAIRNTGAVISEEDLPHIFDRFYRTDKARTSGEGGFGLGLAIAREIARQHGGDITCTSSAADGTCFVATLPLA